jgi:predicted transcriptional regulator
MQIHIGKEIEKVYQKSGMKLSEFARRINTSARNVYSIFARKEIKTDQLQKICEVLNFDFFALYKTGSGKNGKAEETQAAYSSKQNKVVITIELDGQSNTLEQHIRKITAINQLLL